MTHLPENHNLPLRTIRLPNVFLELQDNGTGTVDDIDSNLPGELVGGRRLAMSADQKGLRCGIGNVRDVFFADRDKPFRAEPCEFSLIVDYCPEGIKLLSRMSIQEFLSLANCPDDSSAEARALVDLDRKSHYSRIPNLPWQRPWNQTVSSCRVMSELSRT